MSTYYVNIYVGITAESIVNLTLSVAHLHSLHYIVQKEGAEVALNYMA